LREYRIGNFEVFDQFTRASGGIHLKLGNLPRVESGNSLLVGTN
jgi:hypothetical protein